MSSKVVRKRHWLQADVDQAGTGTDDNVDVFTADRAIRILGWKIVNYSNIQCGDEVGLTGYCRSILSRDPLAPENDYILDFCGISAANASNVAWTEVVGASGNGYACMERHLDRKEANELGLLLDYGESIALHTRAHIGGAAAANATCYGRCQGFLEYEELGGGAYR
mgnify:CR=1 FL=1|jgi:hypothetical protein